MLLVETLSSYGNDWYVIGVELPVGRLVESASLVVTDTFGVRTLLQPAGAMTSGRWGLFRHAMPVEDDEAEGVPISNLLYLAPRVAQPLIGPVVEQVTLTRDEQANVGWAIEQIVESPLQVGVTLSDVRPADPPGDPDVAPDYRLAHEPPPHWIPLLPVRTGPDEQVALARGSVLDVDGRAAARRERHRPARGRHRRIAADPRGGSARRRPRRTTPLPGGPVDRRHAARVGRPPRPARRATPVGRTAVRHPDRLTVRVRRARRARSSTR